ncbi:glycoside hydrolase family 3 protein [uncultured Ruminococcus sp.]|uniref:glycoside hydrolase family 3 protein n=1 Tax=uncultured Ruminococcus sp. TaxID=165186 RepID=UPI00262A67F4|nr:glycoside hydrolase family 3 protein [uncultured Ruminococcus sp.]
MSENRRSIIKKAVSVLLVSAAVICAAVLVVRMKRGSDTVGRLSNASEADETAAVSAEVTTEVTETTTEAPTTTEPPDDITVRIDSMSLHEKVCQLFVVTPESLTDGENYSVAGEMTREALKHYPVGGIIYFAKNIDSAAAISQMISNTSAYASEQRSVPLFYAVDEEGGTVARCALKAGTTWFDPMYYYRYQGTETAFSNAETIASDISALGFNLDFAPVADTWSNPYNTVIGTRAYSDDFQQTADLVASAVEGFHSGGTFCSLKHFPGHGDTAGDSHYGSVYTDKSVTQLIQGEYLAFRSGIASGADMVMVGHITMNGVDGKPATLSRVMITDELRGRLGFDGVVITDSLSMRAMADIYSSGELSVRVLEAGGDMLLMPMDLKEAVRGVEAAVADGRLTEERINRSVRRILYLKSQKMDIKKS